MTGYRVLDHAGGAALVEASPTTGRTHQIRVHMAAVGHPILGDATYGGPTSGHARVMLHAWTLRFEDAAGDRWLATAPPPEDFQRAAADLGLTLPATPASGPNAR